MQANVEQEPISIFEYWKVLKRRYFLFGVPAIAIALLATYYALSLPSIYRSEATILIEDQAIAQDIAGPAVAVSNYAAEQIQSISQRILTVDNIQSVVEKFNVYGRRSPDNQPPAGILANRFRNHTELEFVSAELGNENKVAVAFTLAFESVNPQIAKDVAEELVTLFLNENRRSSASQTAEMSTLLLDAMEEANKELVETETRLAEFKAQHKGALPELYELNLNIINRTEQQLSDVELRIQQLQQTMLQLSAQLAPISPNAAVTLPSGETIMSDRERLKALSTDYRRKKAIYESDHPDLIRLEREIKNLQQTTGVSGTSSLLREQLRTERERLSTLRDKYSDNHPDIKRSQAAISELESQLANADAGQPSSDQAEGADNPAYVLMNTRLQTTKLELENLQKKRAELQKSLVEHEELIRQAPQVEMQYGALVRSYENAKTKHSEIQARLRAADAATNVGQEISGKRFALIEPPLLPIQPEGPNRTAIILMGIILAIGFGVGCVVFAELMDKTVQSARKVFAIVGAPPLVVVPYINNSEDIQRARMRKLYMATALLAVGTLYIALILPLL